MKSRKLLSATKWSMLGLALTVTACASSTKHLPPQLPQATIPSHLLVKPARPPQIPRTTDPATGQPSITGSDALFGINGLYDYIGSVLGQLDTLIDTVKVKEPAPVPPKPHHFLGIKL